MAVADPRNARALGDAGSIMVQLTADIETILGRIGDASDRPMLTGDPRAAIVRLQAERGPVYEAVADLTVDTSSRTADDVVSEIRMMVGRDEAAHRVDLTDNAGNDNNVV